MRFNTTPVQQKALTGSHSCLKNVNTMFLNTFQGVCGKERGHKGRKTRASQYLAKNTHETITQQSLGRESEPGQTFQQRQTRRQIRQGTNYTKTSWTPVKTSRAGQIIIKEGKRKENQTNTTQERKLTIKVKQGHEVLIYTYLYFESMSSLHGSLS